MGFENYISESEAATLAGVSANTLYRFAEAGYLGVESDSDGLRLFSKREIADVFGITDESLASKIEIERATVSETTLSRDSFFIQGQATTESTDHNAAENGAAYKLVSTYTPQPDLTKKSVDHTKAAQTSPDKSKNDEDLAAEESRAQQPSTSARPELLVRLEQDVRRLKSALELQEKLLDLRESEIGSLKSERDWLRIRIERLEEKGDRDQLLLLSETQVLRQLLTQRDQDRRRTPLRAALEWFGLVEAEASAHSTNGLTRSGTINLPKQRDN